MRTTRSANKGETPKEKAIFFIKKGKDQDGMSKHFISTYIGMYRPIELSGCPFGHFSNFNPCSAKLICISFEVRSGRTVPKLQIRFTKTPSNFADFLYATKML